MKIKMPVRQRTRPVDITRHIEELKRGTGNRKPKKGKGSYSRKGRKNV